MVWHMLGGGRKDQPAWPPAPYIDHAVPTPPLGTVSKSKMELPTRVSVRRPTLVIALGRAGEAVLHDWNARLTQDSANLGDSLWVIWVGEREEEIPIPPYCFTFNRLLIPPRKQRAQQGGARGAAHEAFRSAENLQNFARLAHRATNTLGGEAHIVVVGSLAEPIIGVIGDVLQVLHEGGGSHKVLVLLTTSSPEGSWSLSTEEMYAAAREIGRFTFQGTHWMPSLPPEQRGPNSAVHRALIDHFFLLEEPDGLPFEQSIVHAISEMLLLLTHPAGDQLWNSFSQQRNALERQGVLTEATCHTLGIVTLYIPLNEMQDYFASRLAKAALYGERRSDKGPLVTSPQPQIDEATVYRHIKGWLVNSPPEHPLFNELFANPPYPPTLGQIPRLEVEPFAEVFQVKVRNGLLKLLNDYEGTDRLLLAEAILRCLKEYIQVLQRSLPAQTHRDSSAGMQDLKFILEHWLKTARHLHDQIVAWQRVLLPDQVPSLGGAQPTSGIRIPSLSLRPTPRGEEEGLANLWAMLEQERDKCRTALKGSVRSIFRRPVTADNSQGISPADQFYETHLRPELGQHGAIGGASYLRAIQKRLAWWIQLNPNKEPQLRFVCVPPDEEWVGGDPPESASFGPVNGDIRELYRTILKIAHAQVRDVGSTLEGEWLRQRISRVGLVGEKVERLLTFDGNRAAQLRRNMPVDKIAYLATPSSDLARYCEQAFQLQDVQRSIELGRLEAQVTVLKIWFGVPLRSIDMFRKGYRVYQQRAHTLHLYPQEQNAARYERYHPEGHADRLAEREDIQLHPRLVMTLWNPQLVSLFFQALFYGLIERQERTLSGREEEWWVVRQVEGYGVLDLKPATQAEGLLEAFEEWGLKKPLDPDLHMRPPQHPFNNLEDYMRALNAAIENLRRIPLRKGHRQDFEQREMDQLLKWAENDPLGKSFLHLLECEWDNPVWEV